MESAIEKPLLAYSADDGDGNSTVVVARSGAEARRMAASRLETDWEGVELCRRASKFDHFAPGPVPRLALLDAGWWFECYGCERTFDIHEFRNNYDDGDEDEADHYPKPVEHGHGVWCTEECYLLDRADRARRFRAEAEAREAIAGMVVHRYPGAVITTEHAYVEMVDGWYRANQVHIRFSWPGCRHGDACLHLEDGNTQDIHITVPRGDHEAWRAWCDAGYPINGVEGVAA